MLKRARLNRKADTVLSLGVSLRMLSASHYAYSETAPRLKPCILRRRGICLGRIFLAFRSFFAILFKGNISDEAAAKLGLTRGKPTAAPAPAAPAPRPTEGALQILAILQRDSRLIDFLMEDISAYSDDQIGAAVRTLHDQCRQCLGRYVRLAPVIDGVEGTFTKVDSSAQDPSAVKFIGNVPADGRPQGGLLRHRGWRAAKIELPPLAPAQDPAVIAPAEIEIE